jgi:hypothetical protein
MSAISLSEEFIDVFLDADNPFRESISYIKTGSAAKTIYGIVRRGGMQKISNTGRADKTPIAYDYQAIISVDSTDGIDRITPGKDKIVVSSPEFSGTNTFIVAGIIARTGMCWHLGLVP